MTITSMDIAEHIVNRGAALLDQYTPDWFTRVSVETLSINSPVRCVLAQAFGKADISCDYDYGIGLHRLSTLLKDSDVSIGWDFEVRHGFISTWVRREHGALEGLDVSLIKFDADEEVWITGTLLTEAWRAAIAERATVAV